MFFVVCSRRISQDVIWLQVAFNVDINAIKDANNPFLSANAKVLEGVQIQIRTPCWRYYFPMFSFQRNVTQAAKFLREFGTKVIKERQEAIQRGAETPSDILAHILNVAEQNSSLTIEDLVDDFVTFFIAGEFPENMSFAVFDIVVLDIIYMEITVLNAQWPGTYLNLDNAAFS